MKQNTLNTEININNNLEIQQQQQKFLETTLGKIINNAFDIGIQTLLPDFIDDQIVNLKNNLLEKGLKEGIKQTIDDVIDIGKEIVGICTGNFENINQVQNAIKKGGLIDGISSLTDFVVKKIYNKKLINTNTQKILLQGKNIILNNIEKDLQKKFEKQLNDFSQISLYIKNWKKEFENKNFTKMEKEYNKIEKEVKKLMPLEEMMKEAKKIEIIHNLIKENGQNFNIDKEQMDLIKTLGTI